MTRWCLGLALLTTAAGCTTSPHERAQITSDDCFGCHSGDYLSATDPAHVGANPTTCWECHQTDSFRPASQDNHPDGAFLISSGHHGGLGCVDCHDDARGYRVNGANTACTECHYGVHQLELMNSLHASNDVPNYPADPQEPNFCLSCHPDGNAPGQAHPEARFPISEGHHSGLLCLECHDTSRGSSADGANTICTDCHLQAHPRSRTDPIHQGVPRYPTGEAPPNFCLGCHSNGTVPPRDHPENRFPRMSGPHSPFLCVECHDPSISAIKSRETTNCLGCHTGEHADAPNQIQHKYNSEFHDQQATGSPHFCLACHPNGRAG